MEGEDIVDYSFFELMITLLSVKMIPLNVIPTVIVVSVCVIWQLVPWIIAFVDYYATKDISSFGGN